MDPTQEATPARPAAVVLASCSSDRTVSYEEEAGRQDREAATARAAAIRAHVATTVSEQWRCRDGCDCDTKAAANQQYSTFVVPVRIASLLYDVDAPGLVRREYADDHAESFADLLRSCHRNDFRTCCDCKKDTPARIVAAQLPASTFLLQLMWPAVRPPPADVEKLIRRVLEDRFDLRAVFDDGDDDDGGGGDAQARRGAKRAMVTAQVDALAVWKGLHYAVVVNYDPDLVDVTDVTARRATKGWWLVSDGVIRRVADDWQTLADFLVKREWTPQLLACSVRRGEPPHPSARATTAARVPRRFDERTDLLRLRQPPPPPKVDRASGAEAKVAQIMEIIGCARDVAEAAVSTHRSVETSVGLILDGKVKVKTPHAAPAAGAPGTAVQTTLDSVPRKPVDYNDANTDLTGMISLIPRKGLKPKPKVAPRPQLEFEPTNGASPVPACPASYVRGRHYDKSDDFDDVHDFGDRNDAAQPPDSDEAISANVRRGSCVARPQRARMHVRSDRNGDRNGTGPIPPGDNLVRTMSSRVVQQRVEDGRAQWAASVKKKGMQPVNRGRLSGQVFFLYAPTREVPAWTASLKGEGGEVKRKVSNKVNTVEGFAPKNCLTWFVVVSVPYANEQAKKGKDGLPLWLLDTLRRKPTYVITQDVFGQLEQEGRFDRDKCKYVPGSIPDGTQHHESSNLARMRNFAAGSTPKRPRAEDSVPAASPRLPPRPVDDARETIDVDDGEA
jgi:hypothetical protein